MEPQEPSERLKTIRQDIVDLLKSGELTVRDLSQIMKIPEKEVVSHLEHIRKSLSKSGFEINVTPALCARCGFKFKKRESLKKPSRCPVCKGEQIRGQTLVISKR